MRTRGGRVGFVLAAVAVLTVVAAGTARAAVVRSPRASVPAGLLVQQPWLLPQPGYDVSAHQCSGSDFPDPPVSAFGVLNPTAGDLAFSGVNPCLQAEETWAQGTGDVAFYLALSDKGPSSANWPTDNNCRTMNTTACSKEFGEKQAADVLTDAGGVTAGDVWWLDVETGPSWQAATAAGRALNAQVVLGAATYLQGQGVRVGLYSTAAQWAQLIGTSTGFTTYPEWYADGGKSDPALLGDCTTRFAGGSVTQVQDLGTGTALDHDLRCGEPQRRHPPLPAH